MPLSLTRRLADRPGQPPAPLPAGRDLFVNRDPGVRSAHPGLFSGAPPERILVSQDQAGDSAPYMAPEGPEKDSRG